MRSRSRGGRSRSGSTMRDLASLAGSVASDAFMRSVGGGSRGASRTPPTPNPTPKKRIRGGSVLPAEFRSASRSRSRSAPPYVTSGSKRSVGSFSGVRRKGKRRGRTSSKVFNPKLGLRIGTESVNENRRTVSDAQCVYFGQGFSSRDIKDGVCRAVMSRICMKAGLIIRDWNDPLSLQLGQSIRLELQYYASADIGDDILTDIQDVVISDTWDDCATRLGSMFTTLTSASRPLAIKLYDILPTVLPPSSFIYVHRCTLNFSDMMVHMDASSKLKFQNQTPAGTAESSRFETTDIGANPLVGMRYNNKKWSNGFIRKNRGYNEAPGSGFSLLPDITTGFLASTITFPAPTGDYFKKPPPAREFDAKGAKVRMLPGEVGISTVKFSCKISLLNLWSKWPELFSNSGGSTDRLVPFGACELFAFEKTIDSGSEALISLGIQIDQKYKFYCTETRPPINRLVFVGA